MNKVHQYFIQRIQKKWYNFFGILGFGIFIPLVFLRTPEWEQSDYIAALIVSISTTFLIWEGSNSILSWIRKRFPLDKNLVKHLLFEIIALFIYTSFMLVMGVFILSHWVSNVDPKFIDVFRAAFFSVAMSLLLTAIYEGAYLFRKWKISLIETERFKKENMQASLDSLKKQLDPHFLFNSLSVLTSLVYKDPDLAAEFITRLSKVYRYVLEHTEEELVDLNTEIDFLEAYYFLLKVRFDKNLWLNVQVPKELHHKKIPPLTLQILMENAVKHNVFTKENPLHIRLYQQDGYLYFTNNLQERSVYFPSPDSTGLGLDNVIRRYTHFLDETPTIQKEKEEFRVKIPLIERNI
jgi:sensor histidine kinase YesM